MLTLLCTLPFAPPAPPALQTPCDERPSLEALGVGTAGQAGHARVVPDPGPFVGEPSAFAVEGGSAGAGGALFASPTAPAAPVPLPGFGAIWYLGAPLVAEDFVLDADGRAEGLFAQGAVPPTLCGRSVRLQAIQVDPAAAGGLAFTPGLAVRFGARGGPLFDVQRLAAGDGPEALAVADFDGDGVLDLVVADAASGSLRTLLGRGDGTFDAGPASPVGTSPRHLAVGDLDSDGAADLVVLDGPAETASVLLGAGDGTFVAVATLPAGADPAHPRLADLDGDGLLDLVTLEPASDTCRVWLGAGDGSLVPAPPVPTSAAPEDLAVADADGDGRPDLIVAARGANAVAVHHGVGDGTFAFDPATDLHFCGWTPSSLGVGDLDVDGVLDLVVGVCCESVSVLRGLPGGDFANPVAYPACSAVEEPTLVDLDGDGTLELAVICPFTPSKFLFLPVLADGSLGEATAELSSPSPRESTFVDLDGDGTVDLAHLSGVDLSVVLGRPGLGPMGSIPLEGSAPTVDSILADLDTDGVADLVSLRSAGGLPLSTVALGAPDGSFAPPVAGPFAVRTIDVAAVDLDADGRLDLVAVAEEQDRLELALGAGDGTFTSRAPIAVGARPQEVAAGDLDGDGLVDLVVSNLDSDDLSLLFAAEPGVFGPAVSLPAGDRPRGLALADLDADGDLDLVATNDADPFAPPPTTRDGVVWLNAGDGTFPSPIELGPGGRAARVTAGDANRDGVLDLVVVGPPEFGSGSGGLVRVHLGAGDGSFPSAETYDAGEVLGDADLGDVDLDGRADLVFTTGSALRVRPGLPAGAPSLFGPPLDFGAGASKSRVRIVDLDRDGLPDLLAIGTFGGTVALFGRLTD